jgi:ribosomal protein RSM22 (predicted rRNA methylase)
MSARLPDSLFKAVEARLHGVPLRVLRQGYAALSRRYREVTVSESERADLKGADDGDRAPGGGFSPAQARGLGYLAARLPATYAAAQAALRQLPDGALEGCVSVLDLGSGPGTATWALKERWPLLQRACFLESDAEMLKHAQALAAAFPDLKVSLKGGDLLAQLAAAPEHDLVVLAYVLSELDEKGQEALLKQAWAKARRGLFLLEPGTPETSRRVLLARKQLLAENGVLVAPCPQMGPCPAEKGSFWCHFSVRLERRGLHKRVKVADIGYEDEKYSWIFVSKDASQKPAAPYRLHAFPHRGKRHIELDVCDRDGKRSKIFLHRRKTPASLRWAARKLQWGDAWDPAKAAAERPEANPQADV